MNLISQDITIILILVVVALFIFSIVLLLFLRKNNQVENTDKLLLKIREEIKFAVSPKFLDVSVGVNELVELAIEIWHIEQRISKSSSSLPDNQLKGLESSIRKLRRYLEKHDIEIVDYKNHKYNDGLNLDILSVEKDPSLQEDMIKETVEPTIMCKGQVVHKAKIVLLKTH